MTANDQESPAGRLHDRLLSARDAKEIQQLPIVQVEWELVRMGLDGGMPARLRRIIDASRQPAAVEPAPRRPGGRSRRPWRFCFHLAAFAGTAQLRRAPGRIGYVAMAGAVAALLTFLGMTMAGPGQDTRVEGQSDDISIATTAPNLR